MSTLHPAPSDVVNDENISPDIDLPTPPSTLPSEHERTQKLRERGLSLGRATKEPFRTGLNAENENALHNDVDAKQIKKRETLADRRMADLSLQGFTIGEIATLLEVTRQTVSNTLRQPWARDYMISTSRQDIVKEVQDLLKKEVLPSLQTLIEVRDDPANNPATRAGAANSLIERLLGKAAQPIITTATDPTKLSDDELLNIARTSPSSTRDN